MLQNWVGGFLCNHLPTTRMNDEIMQQNSNRLRSMYGMSPMNLNTPTTYNNIYVKMSIKIFAFTFSCFKYPEYLLRWNLLDCHRPSTPDSHIKSHHLVEIWVSVIPAKLSQGIGKWGGFQPYSEAPIFAFSACQAQLRHSPSNCDLFLALIVYP